MSEIIVMRHAPTASNINEVYMGILDTPLSDTYDMDVRQLKEIFTENGCTFCYTSPLKRAYDTARVLFSEDYIIVDKRIIERDLGLWAGVSKKTIRDEYPLAFNENGTMDFYYTPEKGEPFMVLVRRVADFLISIHSLGTSIAIVTHNGVIRVMKSLILGTGLSEVFSQHEPHLKPQRFSINENVIRIITEDCFYTVDRT